MAGRHTSLSHYCRLTTRHSDRRLDTSRSLHSVVGCRITSQSLHSVFGYRIFRPASGHTFPLCIRRLIICITLPHWVNTVHGRTQQGVWSNRITIPYWADTVHGRTKHGVCFLSFSFIFLLLRLLLRSTTLPSHISRAASSLVAFAAKRLSDANAAACSSSSPLSTRPLEVKGAIINTETGDEEID